MVARSTDREVSFTVALALAAGLTNIRLGSFQPQDVVLLLLLGSCLLRFLWSGFSFRVAVTLSGLCRSYLALFLVIGVLALLSFRLEFFPLVGVSALKQPMLFSISRLLQLGSILCGFLWLTNLLIRLKQLLLAATTVYWRVGIASSLYSIFCFAWLSVYHMAQGPNSIFGAYTVDGGMVRARGFFNEGGPFGTYLVSVCVVGLLRRHLAGKRLGIVNIAIVGTAFVLSASKAGFFAAALLLVYYVTAAASFWRKISYLTVSLVVLGTAASLLHFEDQLSAYLLSYQTLEEEAMLRSDDYNLVAGRVAAAYIVPRMLAAHPVTGIGFGNYPLMRNDPQYRGFLPSLGDIEDSGGLGIPQLAAEIGLPATFWLVILLLTPYSRSRKQSRVLTLTALFQPMAHIFGVQLTFFYPWFVSACVLAALRHQMVETTQPQTLLELRFRSLTSKVPAGPSPVVR